MNKFAHSTFILILMTYYDTYELLVFLYVCFFDKVPRATSTQTHSTLMKLGMYQAEGNLNTI